MPRFLLIALILLLTGCASSSSVSVDSASVAPSDQVVVGTDDATATAIAEAVSMLFMQTAAAPMPQSIAVPELVQGITDPEQDPVYVTRVWITALVSGRGADVGHFTCRALSDGANNASTTFGTLFGTIDSLLQSLVGVSAAPTVDLTYATFSLIEQDAQRAVVRIGGEAFLTAGGAYQQVRTDGDATLLYEDNRWKVCDLASH